jgi:hypothetical protein
VLHQLSEAERSAASEIVSDGNGDRRFRIALPRCKRDAWVIAPFPELDSRTACGRCGHLARTASRTTAAGERREENPERERSSKPHGLDLQFTA